MFNQGVYIYILNQGGQASRWADGMASSIFVFERLDPSATCFYMYTCVHTYIYIYMYVYIYIYIYTCIYVYMYICIYVYGCTYKNIYMYIFQNVVPQKK